MVKTRPHDASQAVQLVSVQTPDTLDALILLAATCERDGYPLQAIHCLKSLLKASLVPTMEARARLNLGRLLLDYTWNCKEAHKELLRAQTLAQGLLGAVSLKCEICCQMARYFQTQGQGTYQVQMYEQALQMCEGGSASSEGASLVRWTAHLYLLKAQAHAADADITKAHQAAQAGLAYCAQHAQQQQQQLGLADCHVLLHLFQVQLHLVCENPEGFDTAYALAVQSIAEVREAAGASAAAAAAVHPITSHPSLARTASCSSPGSHPPPGVFAGPAAATPTAAMMRGFIAGAHLHLKLLQALHLLVSGQAHELMSWAGEGYDQQGLGPAQHLEQLAQEAADEAHTGYTWLRKEVISGLAHLMSATVFAYKNRMTQALAQVDAGKQALAGVLSEMGIQLDEAVESSLDAVTQLECRCPLAVACQLDVVRANCLMAAGNMSAARQCITRITSLVERFPHQLHQLSLVVHMLVGQYCHATGELQAAAHHLEAVKQNSRPGRTQLLASAMLAVTRLAAQHVDDLAVQAAIDALGANTYAQHAQAQGTLTEQEQPLGACTLESVMCDLTCALIKLRLDQFTDAKVILTQVLRTAHQQLHHFGLVAQTMLLLAPLLMQQGDVTGAEQLLTNSTSLARGQPAIQVMIHQATQQLRSGSPAHKAASQLSSKAQQVAAQIAAAKLDDAAAHTGLLSWGLAPVQT